MADQVNNDPKMNDLLIDAREFDPYLHDVPPGGLQGLRVEKEGLADVTHEIVANQPLWGDKAGITQGDFTEFTTICARIGRLDVFIGPVRKLLELLEETRAVLVDQRERLIHASAKSIDGRAKTKSGEALLARYEKTRAYRSLSAIKGVRTRQRNAAKADPQKPEAPKGPEAPKSPAPAES